jgi:hypothetical protein
MHGRQLKVDRQLHSLQSSKIASASLATMLTSSAEAAATAAQAEKMFGLVLVRWTLVVQDSPPTCTSSGAAPAAAACCCALLLPSSRQRSADVASSARLSRGPTNCISTQTQLLKAQLSIEK